MTKEKVTKNRAEKRKATVTLEVINAHAGEYGGRMGTFITYKQGKDTHQAWYCWSSDEVKIVVTDMERKLSEVKGE